MGVGKESGKIDFVRWFSELNSKDIKIAGGKGASLAEMYNNKFPIPSGFIVTAQTYRKFITDAGIDDKIKELLRDLDINDTDKLTQVSGEIRKLIEKSEFSKEIKSEVIEAYESLDVGKITGNASSGAMEILKTSHEPPFVAVRSSATAEDLEDASFAGQQESFLNVKGNPDLLKKIKKCFSSLFTARAIFYREKKGFDHLKTELAVVVQKMIDSDKSGVVFSRNPIKNDGMILIEAVWGLGEGIVSGRIKPDKYLVSRDLENFDLKDIKINDKKVAIVRDSSGKTGVVKLTEEKSKQRVLINYEIKRLGQFAIALEEHYGIAQDIEFAIAGGEIFIVQSRPITTKVSDENLEEIDGTILLSGLGASPGIASGTVRIVRGLEDLSKIKPGDVLVTEMTNPDMVVAMQRAAAIVTDEGGVTSHAAIVSREMGIPAVVGTAEATEKLEDGIVITVDGNTGRVLEGRTETKLSEVKEIEETKTKIKVIVDLPDFAERAAKSGAKSVGLVRLEGIIATGGKHPLKFVKENKMKDYVSLLSKGLKKITKEFEEVWIRSSDIRSDEFRNLEGASKEIEGNPMLGDHGVRFSLRHPEILRAELLAVKEIADEFPDKKIGIMMPQIISLSELKEVKRIAREETNVPKNVKIGIMVETPAAVQLINQFCEEGIDFVSFGTNDLTQYTLAIDRNNGDVQYLYDEMHPAVLSSISYVIRRCKKYGVETSICGQAGSKEEMARFLVNEGIDSISVNADAAHKVSLVVKKVEGELLGKETESEEADAGFGDIEEGKDRKAETLQVVPSRIYKSNDMDQDIEDIVLRELEGGESNRKDEYSPGNPNDWNVSEDVPPLNDVIPVSSSDFEEKHEEKEIDFSENLIEETKNSSEEETENSEKAGLLDGEDEDDDVEFGDDEEAALGEAVARELEKEWEPSEFSKPDKDIKLDIF